MSNPKIRQTQSSCETNTSISNILKWKLHWGYIFIQPRLALNKAHHKSCSVKSEFKQKYISVRFKVLLEINTPFLVMIIVNHNALRAYASRNGSWRRFWATEKEPLERTSFIYWWRLMLEVFIRYVVDRLWAHTSSSLGQMVAGVPWMLKGTTYFIPFLKENDINFVSQAVKRF